MCGTDCKSNTDQQDSSYIEGISKSYKMFCKIFFLEFYLQDQNIFLNITNGIKKWFSLIGCICCYNIVFTTISF